MRTRLLLAAGSVLALVVATFNLAPTSAAWHDAVNAEVSVRAGTWETTTTTTLPDDPDPEPGAVSCYPVDPSVNAECTAIVSLWEFWWGGYGVTFGVESESSDPFEWEIRVDFSMEYEDEDGNPILSQGVPMFPGLTVPFPSGPGTWQANGLSQSWEICAPNGIAEWPVVRFRGVRDGNMLVSASSSVTNLGLQVADWGWSHVPPACG